MSEFSRVLSAIENGEAEASEHLLPLVYEELRRLAHRWIARERPGQTLQATALVHEAYLRLAGGEETPSWSSRAHFFGAAAEAMRRILIDRARRKRRPKHGGGRRRLDLDTASPACEAAPDALLAIDEALTRLDLEYPEHARLVKLRHYAGCTLRQAAEILNISATTAKRR